VREGTSGLEAFKAAPHFELIASNLMHAQDQKLKDALG
jgi:hypothetical protein